jgi:hypothetical protein
MILDLQEITAAVVEFLKLYCSSCLVWEHIVEEEVSDGSFYLVFLQAELEIGMSSVSKLYPFQISSTVLLCSGFLLPGQLVDC